MTVLALGRNGRVHYNPRLARRPCHHIGQPYIKAPAGKKKETSKPKLMLTKDGDIQAIQSVAAVAPYP